MRIGVLAALATFAALAAVPSCTAFTADPGTSTDPDGGTSDGSAAPSYAATVLADVPLLYYRLGETATSGPALDRSPSSRNAELKGNVTVGVPGAIAGDPDTAFRFDGQTSAVVLASGPTFEGKAHYTIEAWARPKTTDGGHVITACQAETGGGWAMFFDSDPRPIIERQVGVASDRLQGGSLPATGFAHLVGTFDGTTQRLYVDGELVNSAASSKMMPGPASVPFAIGANGVSGTNARFEGDIDEVAIYDHVLTIERIRAHHRVGTGLPP